MQEGFEFGFYNSKSDSIREYDAKQFGRIFDGVIVDGIFPSIGDNFAVTSISGLKIKVGTGKAWFNKTWNEVTQPMQFKLDDADATQPRMDTVVLRIRSNELIRENDIYIKTGVPSSSPEPPDLIKDDAQQIWEYPIAVITLGVNVSSITNSNITNFVGLDSAPIGMTKYSNFIPKYSTVISDNAIGSGTIIVHTGANGSTETNWTSFSGGYKKIFTNINNIQNSLRISKNATFNTDLYVDTTDMTSIKNVQNLEESFSYIYKYEVNDNSNQLILYSYYKTKVTITVRFVGKGVSNLK